MSYTMAVRAQNHDPEVLNKMNLTQRTHGGSAEPPRLAPRAGRRLGVALPFLAAALGLFALALLAGCSALPTAEDLTPLAARTLGPYPSFTPVPSVTPKDTPTTAPSVTPLPTNTMTPSITPRPTNTPTPSNTPTATAVPIEALPGARASADSAQQEVAKVALSIAEVRLLSYEEALQLNRPLFNQGAFRLVQTVGVLSIAVANNSTATVRVAPNKGLLVIADEQVELERFAGYSDNVGGDLLPGIIRDGYILFGVKRYAPEEIDSIRLVLSAPANTRGRALSTKGYDITIAIE